MGVAQVGCKNRQPTFDVFARSIPADQGLDGEAMPKVMQAGTVMVIGSSQADLAGEAIEGAPNVRTLQRSAAGAYFSPS